MQSQKAVSAYFTSKQILPFGFADQYSSMVSLGNLAQCMYYAAIMVKSMYIIHVCE